MQDDDNRVNGQNGIDFEEIGEESTQPSSRFDFEVNERKRLSAYQEILQSYDELKIDCKNLKEAKVKILRCLFKLKFRCVIYLPAYVLVLIKSAQVVFSILKLDI